MFPDKKYVIVLYRDENELDGFKDKIAIVEEDEKNSNIKTLNQDCFLQIINGLDGAESVDLNIGSQLQKAKLFKSFSLASVIKPGITNLEILNKIENINCQSNDRILAIINGTVDNPSILIKNYKQSAATAKTYLRRFINVSDINDLYIGLNNDSSRIFANPINYGVLSDYETINQERKMSLFFGLAKNIRHIDVKFRLDDISLVFGKTYDIIFAGNSKSGYSAIIYQEY